VYTEAEEMIEKLSAVVQAQGGMFEFRIQTVAPVPRQRPLMTNQLVMALVCHVDEQMAREQEMVPSHYWYTLEMPEPDIWIEPELDSFFQATRQFLASGMHADELAQRLNLDISVVQRNLTNLRLLGVVKMVDGVKTVPLEDMEVSVEEEVSRKSNNFIRASRAASEIVRISGKLPRPLSGKLPKP
jgi:hypothetical protein